MGLLNTRFYLESFAYTLFLGLNESLSTILTTFETVGGEGVISSLRLALWELSNDFALQTSFPVGFEYSFTVALV
jgi:hypothetical protein